MRTFLIFITLLGSLQLRAFEPLYSHQNKISFDEKFVFNPEAALKELIPGTEDYYYYNCLHFQHQKDYQKVNQLLKSWNDKFRKTERYKTILNRQMLFLYEQFPVVTQNHLTQELKLRFNHQKLTASQEAIYPNSLDQNLINWAKFKNYPIYKLNDHALELIDQNKLSVSERRALLTRVKNPDFPNLVKLIVADLNVTNKKTFGYLQIHRKLTAQQMDKCLSLRPALKSNPTFVNEYIKRLTPAEHTNWQQLPELKEAYLNELWKFTSSLGPAFNSLKAHSLLQKLSHDQSLAKYSEAHFIEYLKLPRHSIYNRPDLLRNSQYIVNQNKNYSTTTSLPPLERTETNIITDLLHHFLKDAKNNETYLPYINEKSLNKIFAKTKILYGKGDPQKWFPLIEKYSDTIQELKEKVELTLLPENKTFLSSNEKISLSLEVKNVPNLLVKIFKLNQFNYYKANNKQLSTDIDLDGMVATQEQTFIYSQAPHIRHKETFNFDLKSSGAYVIEFIGNGISSRALIHKGYLSYTQEPTAAGHLFHIYDDETTKITNASIYLDGHTYKANNKGFILVPYTSKSKTQKFIITHGDFASFENFVHKKETYNFDANFFIHRETLIPNTKTKVLINSQLTLNGSRVPLKVLKPRKLSRKIS